MGPNDLRWPIRTRPSRIHGLGAFAHADIPARRLIGVVSGVLRPLPAARDDQRRRPVIKLVEISRRWALDCTHGNALSNLNHSCRANCYLRIARRQVEVWSRTAITAGQELTVDYRATQHPGGMRCHCGAPDCRDRL